MNKKVVLGLSGGVDSAVAALLLKERGYQVLGLFLDIGLPGGVEQARAAAEGLDIPLRIADIRPALHEKVCRPFIDGYLKGQTPNPCILCNPGVKFKALEDHARELGAAWIATGHYARSRRCQGQALLLKGHPDNDQSYLLCRITKSQLDRLIFPLGDYPKERVREMARERGLSISDKAASMEICFIPQGDHGSYIESMGRGPGPGDFVDQAGRVLGRHRGIHRYTLGQRRGLGISAGHRVFVSEIRPETNQVVLTKGSGLFKREITAIDMNWLAPLPESPFPAQVKVRHSKNEAAARVTLEGNRALLMFDTPVRAPTPGQSAVMYDGELLLGGGFIV